MAVYTVVDKDDIEAFIKPFGIGPLVTFEGVASGVKNTHYFITTDQSNFASELHPQPLRHYVLTIFENINIDELKFYITLTNLLSLKNLPVPNPLSDANGIALHRLQGKPALLVPKMEGRHPQQPNKQQCQAIGHTLAQVHRICLDSNYEHHALHGLSWLKDCATELNPLLEKPDQQLLEEIPRFIQLSKHSNLLQSVIHGELLRDKTLFQDNHLVAITDFDNAGSGFLMLDLAITVNDWCSTNDGSLDGLLTTELLHAYQKIRSLTKDEIKLWNDFLRLAAAQLWLSRLNDQLQCKSRFQSDSLIEAKNPLHYKNILLQRIHNPQQIGR